MKKTLAILLALILALVNVAALAEEATEPAYKEKLDQKLVFPKTYTITGGTAPAETFTYKFEGVSYKNGAGEVSTDAEDIPAIANQTIAFSAISATTDQNFELDFDMADYELGVYTYKITEVIPTPKTAGVTYSEDPYYLVLTILSEGTANKHFVAALHQGTEDGDKEDNIENKYDASGLTVEKVTTGNMADLSKKFTFTITFTAADGTEVKSAITATNATVDTSNPLKYTASLANGESATFANLPVGVAYTIEEDPEEYECDKADNKATGTIAATATTETFTNKLEVEVDTGVALESVPYIMILAVVMIGAALLVLRKREEY